MFAVISRILRNIVHLARDLIWPSTGGLTRLRFAQARNRIRVLDLTVWCRLSTTSSKAMVS